MYPKAPPKPKPKPTAKGPTNTKRARRREQLFFEDLEQLKRELQRIWQAETVGVLRTSGNWTPAQILEHVAIFWEFTLDGFPDDLKPPLPVRLVAKALNKKRAAAGYPPSPGFKLPKDAARHLAPSDDPDFDNALARLRRAIARTEQGHTFTHRSPLFGEFTHGQWVKLNLGHAALHLSFLHPE